MFTNALERAKRKSQVLSREQDTQRERERGKVGRSSLEIERSKEATVQCTLYSTVLFLNSLFVDYYAMVTKF